MFKRRHAYIPALVRAMLEPVQKAIAIYTQPEVVARVSLAFNSLAVFAASPSHELGDAARLIRGSIGTLPCAIAVFPIRQVHQVIVAMLTPLMVEMKRLGASRVQADWVVFHTYLLDVANDMLDPLQGAAKIVAEAIELIPTAHAAIAEEIEQAE